MQKKQTILVVASLLVVVLSVTLAYFTAQIIGEGKDVSVSSADLKIVFTDTDGNIEGSNITLGWSNSKTFTVKNESNGTYKYDIIIKDLVNTFKTYKYLQYKITSPDGGYNMTDYSYLPKSSSAEDVALAYEVSIDKGKTHTYTIEIKYVNDFSEQGGDFIEVSPEVYQKLRDVYNIGTTQIGKSPAIPPPIWKKPTPFPPEFAVYQFAR